ncbi:MAG: efflux RND transporter periplasmic adaptor subunit [Candidatus Wallbacteria bacterium]|nr:efflux RND transporter periplasmic adaptor subunit [Candidatus Wallbacteria bacterium]
MKRYLLLPLIATVFFFAWSCKKSDSTVEQTGPVAHKIENGSIIINVSASGSVRSNFDVEIKSKSSGQVIKLPFDISDAVEKGELIAELDPTDELRNVERKRIGLFNDKAGYDKAISSYNKLLVESSSSEKSVAAKLASSKTAFDNARNKLSRQKEFFKNRFISTEEIETVQESYDRAHNSLIQIQLEKDNLVTLIDDIRTRSAEVALALNRVRMAELDLADAELRLAETKIYSPIDGFVVERQSQLGQIVASGISNVGGGTALFKISDLSRLFIETAIDESDISKLEVGNRASINVEAYPDKRFLGEVIRIGIKGNEQSNIVTFKVEIEVIDEDMHLLKPGMTANVEIMVASARNVLVAPAKGVFGDKDGFYVKLPGDKTKRVKVGLKSIDRYEIIEGLTEGEEIMIDRDTQNSWTNRRGGPGIRMMGAPGGRH